MRIKLAIIVAATIVSIGAAAADTTVDGYYRKDGTYVPPYQRTDPNRSKDDNYSTRGNTNPYTDKRGTKNPYK